MKSPMNLELKVVDVTNDPVEHLAFAAASAEYPQLVEHVKDEIATFIVEPKTGSFWPAAEFFDRCAVTTFLVNSVELPLREKTCPDGRPLT